MSGNEDRKQQEKVAGVRIQRLVPLPEPAGSAVDFIAEKVSPKLSVVFVFLLPVITGLSAALWAAAASSSMLVGALYGIILFLAMSILIIGFLRMNKWKEPPKFMQQAFQFNRQVLAEYNMRKNQGNFLKTALIVMIFMFYHFLVMHFLGRAEYWGEAFTIFLPRADDGITVSRVEPLVISLPVFLIFWSFAIWMFPRLLVFVLLFLLHAMSLFLGLFGALFFIQQAPFLLMMPLFMVGNFFMMFGPLAIINIMQIKVALPGEGKADEGKRVVGQPYAKKQLDRVLFLFASPEGEKLGRKGAKPPRGVLLEGPPGVGKTLFAKWAASVLNAPIIITSGSAFIATFLGIDIVIALYLKIKAHGLAKEFGKVVVFIDECEQVFRRRSGMSSGMPGAMRTDEFWSLFKYDEHGSISSCGLTPINSHVAKLRASQANGTVTSHPQMFPGMGMGMGGSMALFVFLPWIDGFESPPFWPKFIRSKVNYLLDVLWLLPPLCFVPLDFTYPVVWPKIWHNRGVSFRFGPAKPDSHKVLFMLATNMPQLLDDAVTRSGRVEERVRFIMPDEAGRIDTLKFYLLEYKNQYGEPGIAHDPALGTEEKIAELARSTRGLSQADLESMLRRAIAIRFAKVNRIEQLQETVERGEKLNEMEEKERVQYEALMQNPGWDNVWATWDDVVEALAERQHGVAAPPPSTLKKEEVVKRIQRSTAYHEIGGHLLPLFFFCGKFQTPTFVSVVRRGEKLGLVAHAPSDEEEWADLDQWKIEGLMRVSFGSLAAERIFLESHDNGPGVSSDEKNGTSIGLRAVQEWSMLPRESRFDKLRKELEKKLPTTPRAERAELQKKVDELKARAKEEYLRYEEYGEMIASLPDVHVGEGGGSLAGLGMFKRKYRNFLVMLGQGYVDAWRVIHVNQEIIHPMVETVVAKGEITGNDLETMWNDLKKNVKPLGEEHLELWPELGTPNKFYGPEFYARSESHA